MVFMVLMVLVVTILSMFFVTFSVSLAMFLGQNEIASQHQDSCRENNRPLIQAHVLIPPYM
jgi:hypothetical protein